MILYGRYLSPYVRRVAVWLGLQEREFDLQPLMVTGDDFGRLLKINPVGRVPALLLEDGELLVETSVIIDWLESTAPSWGKRLLPRKGGDRRGVMQIIGYANGVADKAVSLVYERQRRPEQYHWPEWQQRLETQLLGGLDWLEAQAPESGYFGGSRPKGADVTVVATYDFVENMHPELLRHPKLHALSRRANRRAVFARCHPKTVTG